MERQRIKKRPEDCAGANFRDYDTFSRDFSWEQARALLDGLPAAASTSPMRRSTGT